MMSSNEQNPQDVAPSKDPKAEPEKPEAEKTLPPSKDGDAAPASQSTSHMYQPNVVVQGDHTNITNTGFGYSDIREIVKDVLKDSLSESGSQTNTRDAIKLEFAETLQSQRRNAFFMDDASPQSAVGTLDILKTRVDIGNWYYGLSEEKQITVQAVAILHGARTKEVGQLREELYQSVREKREQREAVLQFSATPSPPSHTRQFQSSALIYEHTQTEFRIVNNVERIFWSDTDEHGTSSFSLRILHFLAQEASRGGWGPSGQIFSDAAQRWTETSTGDVYWRAARATGIIWRSLDNEQLERLANKWAGGDYQRSWRRAASLLYGAYEFESATHEEQEQRKPYVPVILNQWVKRAHAYSNIRVGCAAAFTYGLIGRRFPELALQYLDKLLAFPRQNAASSDEGIPYMIFVAIVSNYVSLIWIGHLRLLLHHIATRIEEFILRRNKPEKLSEASTYRFQRTIALEAMFNAFFIITGTSLPDAQDTTNHVTGLMEPLTNPITLPDQNGRDTILVGILIKGKSGWRKAVVKIICGALIENKSKLAFVFLQQWTLQVLRQKGPEEPQLRDSLLRFFIQIDRTLELWGQILQQAGFLRQQARNTYRHHLIGWYKSTGDLSDFAQKVIESIDKRGE